MQISLQVVSVQETNLFIFYDSSLYSPTSVTARHTVQYYEFMYSAFLI